MTTAGPGIFGFLEFSLDVANATLRRGTESVPLRPKPFAVLQHLAERPGRLVTKAELLDAVWTNTAVTDWVLTSAVKELREALGDDAREPRIIETVHRRGYRFIAATRGESAIVRGEFPASPDDVVPGGAIVGRQAELDVLDGYWRRALAAERHVVFVVGEAGIGKTTLVDQFVQRSVDPAVALIARGQCIEQHGAGEPYLPVLEALGRLCATRGGGPIVDVLRRHAPAWLVQIPGVIEPAECEALERRLGASTRERMLRDIAALVAALPAPLVLLLEDLHWCDHATLDLVSTLAQRRDPARLLVIGTYRPVEVALGSHPLRTVHHDLRTRALCRELWLAPLSEAAVAEYLEARWPGVTSAAPLARVLHEHTDGNPLFLVNIGEYLAGNGAVVEADGRWRVQGEAAALTVDIPQGLRQLIAAQIDRLNERERRLLEVGSVAGREFSAALVAAALAEDVVEVEQRLAELSETGLLISAAGASEWPDGVVAGAYRFDHFVYQSVLRDRVPPARRRQLHERLAARLEQAYQGQLAEISAELAFHLEASGQAERAVPYLEEAAARATRLGAHREAAALLEHALALLDPLPATPERRLRTIRVCMALGPALAPTHGHGDPRIVEISERARRISEESNDPVQLFQSLTMLVGTHLAQARFDRAQEAVQQLDRLLPSMPMPAFIFAGSLLIGMVKYHAGDLREAHELVERAMSFEEVPLPLMSFDLYAIALRYRTVIAIHLGYPDRARGYLREAARLAAARERPYDPSAAAHLDCFIHVFLRDLDGLATAAADAASLEDAPAIAFVGHFCRGHVQSARGDHAGGLETMRRALDAYRAAGQTVGLPLMLALLAEGHAGCGDLPSAFDCVAAARAAAGASGEIRALAEIHRVEGTLHAAGGDRGAAERCFRQAIAVARKQAERWWELRAVTSLARLAPKNRRAAHDQLAMLVASFDEGFDTLDLREARDLVESRLPGQR